MALVGGARLSLLALAKSGLGLVKCKLSCWLALGSSKQMADPPQLPRSDGEDERLLCCPPVDLDIGDFVETLDTEYDAVTTRSKGVDAVFI